jgi:hypothetical protein
MTTSPDAPKSFCEENEDELKVLARVLVAPRAGEVAAAVAALLVKVLTGSSVASGFVEQAVTKALGQRFADTPDARLLAAAQTFRKAQEHRAALQEFADVAAPLINQATADAKGAIATLQRSQQHLFEGQQEGFDILARALSEVLDGVGRLESGQAELPAAVARAVGVSASAEAPALPASASASRLYNVPHPSLSFVGRLDELERLGAELAVGRHLRVCASVEGLPGIGKTELVLRLAHQLAAQNRYPGGVFWLSAEDPNLELTWSSEEISAALGVTIGTAAERARSVVNLLSRLSDPVLVILDNVETWSEATKPSPLPSGMHVTLLVTTRRRDLGGSRFGHFSLGFLSPADSRELLSSIAGGCVEEHEGFDELLAQLDGHALAVELAAVYLREVPDMTPAEYLAKLVAGARLDATVAEQVRYEATVEQAFTLLWKRLDANTQYLWQLAAQFAPVVVSASLANACGMNAEARRTLRRYHLIDLADDGGFRMHRLTRGFGRSRNDLLPLKNFIYGVAGRAVETNLESFFRIYGPDRLHFEEALKRSATPEDTAAWTILLHRIVPPR